MSEKQKLTEAKKQDHLKEAASSYREAASIYPPDDEHSQCEHPLDSIFFFVYENLYISTDYLCYAIDYLQRLNRPLRETLPLLATLRKNNPRMLQIWEVTTLAPSRDKIINAMLAYEKKALAAIARKEVTENDPFPPKVKRNQISLIGDILAGTIYK